MKTCKRGLHEMDGENVYETPDGRRRCIACRTAYKREWAKANYTNPLGSVRAWYARRRALIYNGVRCTDCDSQGGDTYHTRMEFDHVRGPKLFNIGELSHSLAEIRRELKKCEPVCNTCHRRRTAARRLKIAV